MSKCDTCIHKKSLRDMFAPVTIADHIRAMDLEAKYYYWAQCPCRDQIAWDNGEPYKEPTPTQTDRERLAELICEKFVTYSDRAQYIAGVLIANGVTFREG